MKMLEAQDEFIRDYTAEGRLRSNNSILAYRRVLNAHADDVSNRDPSKTGKNDVKRTLARWSHPNSRRQAHSILRSFYKWTISEDIRTTNPADQVRDARPMDPQVFRPTISEVVALMDASQARRRDRWIIHLGVLAGVRRAELVGLKGKHFSREGFVWVSRDIGKGGKERWIPVLPELQPIVDEIRTLVPLEAYVLGRMLTMDPGVNRLQVEVNSKPMSAAGVYKLVQRVGRQAGLPVDIGCHTLRHAFGTHVARYSGLRAAQALMGHQSVETTAGTYTDRPSLDELAVSVQGFSYRQLSTRNTPAEATK